MSSPEEIVYKNVYLRKYIYSFVYLGKKLKNGNNDHVSFFGKKMFYEQGQRIKHIELNSLYYLKEWIRNDTDFIEKGMRSFLKSAYLYPSGWVLKSPSHAHSFFAQASYGRPPFIKFLDSYSIRYWGERQKKKSQLLKKK